MYPKWIAKVTRLACKDCRYCTSFHDIVGIGMTRPSRQEAYAGPLALITLACPGCGVRIHVTVREPVESHPRDGRDDPPRRRSPPQCVAAD
jgi:DNA-directed RNA polymerase subunit RPC12/RpoP